MGVGGNTVMPVPTFDKYFVAEDQDTLIEQSLTLIKQPYLFLFEATQFYL